MNNPVFKTDSNLEKPNENDTVWGTLSDKEKLVLLALLMSKSDTEALKRSPIKKTQFYEYKKRLEPIKKKLITELLAKAMEIIQGNTIKAAEVLAQELDHPNEKIRQQAAETILDRAIGRPNISIQQTYVNKPRLDFKIIGVSQEKIDALFKPDDESIEKQESV